MHEDLNWFKLLNCSYFLIEHRFEVALFQVLFKILSTFKAKNLAQDFNTINLTP